MLESTAQLSKVAFGWRVEQKYILELIMVWFAFLVILGLFISVILVI